MTRFSCIGQACEDHCCHGWQVHVDRDHYGKIGRALRARPDGLRLFEASIELLPATQRRRASFARLKLLDDGTCPLLDSDRLCSLQRLAGPAILPEICATFPRYVVDARTRIEVTAALACPEATRLAILAPDATDIVELSPEEAARAGAPGPLDGTIPRAFLAHLHSVRARMHGLLGRVDFPLRSRLYFALELQNQLRPLNPDSDAAARILEAWDETDLMLELHEHFQGQRPRLPLDLAPLVAAAGLFHDKVPHSRFSALSLGILRGFLPTEGRDREAEVALPMPEVVAEFQRRREIVLAAFSDRVDLYLQNFCRHMWIKEWYGQLESGLDAYLRGHLLRATLFRFLLLSHPGAVNAARDPEGGAAALDQIAVQLVYSLSRAMDSNKDLPAQFQKVASEQLPDLASTISLLAV